MGPHVRRKRSWSNSAEDTGRKVPSGPALRWRRTWRKRGREDRRKEVGEREEKGERERERRVRGKRDGREEENVVGSYSFKVSLVTHYCVHNSLPD